MNVDNDRPFGIGGQRYKMVPTPKSSPRAVAADTKANETITNSTLGYKSHGREFEASHSFKSRLLPFAAAIASGLEGENILRLKVIANPSHGRRDL